MKTHSEPSSLSPARTARADDSRFLALGVLVLAVLWTTLMAGLLIREFLGHRRTTRELAQSRARAYFNKDQAFRFWGTSHGGVYVPTDARTPPNPSLSHVAERDIETPSGRKLTLMNPAYMLRQMMEDYSELYGVRGRITSLKPLRAENAPDAWEAKALAAFETGVREVSEYTEDHGEPYLRLMRPMVTQEGCLKCHGLQGYKVGDVRGGVGLSLPLGPLRAAERASMARTATAFGAIWLAGLAGVGGGYRLLRRRIIERQRLDAALGESRQRMELALAGADLGTWDWQVQTGRVAFSDRWTRMLGYEPGELEPHLRTWEKLVHPDDMPRVQEVLGRHLNGETASYETEHRLQHKSGEWIWVLDKGRVIERDADGRPLRACGTHLDIAERKQVDEELRLNREQIRLLAARSAEAEEKERQRIAAELHDQVGQALTVLSLNLTTLQAQIPEPLREATRARFQDSLALVGQTTRCIRTVMAELRPPVLDDFGLVAALRWLGDQFARRTGVEVRMQSADLAHRLGSATEINLFRIAQEALNNVAKHASASCVTVSIESDGRMVHLRIADNGDGLDDPARPGAGCDRGWGIVSMKERALALGGQCRIEPCPDGGTAVMVEAPL